jgi:hypothetical protein
VPTRGSKISGKSPSYAVTCINNGLSRHVVRQRQGGFSFRMQASRHSSSCLSIHHDTSRGATVVWKMYQSESQVPRLWWSLAFYITAHQQRCPWHMQQRSWCRIRNISPSNLGPRTVSHGLCSRQLVGGCNVERTSKCLGQLWTACKDVLTFPVFQASWFGYFLKYRQLARQMKHYAIVLT